jgi:hypothetical protein
LRSSSFITSSIHSPHLSYQMNLRGIVPRRLSGSGR